MTDGTYNNDVLKGTAMAVPAADRTGQPDFAIAEGDVPGQPDPADTTSIRHGAQAVTGRYVWSASRMAVNGDALALYEQLKKAEDRRNAQEARELANLAQWNTQMTMVGGVMMTNAEAQDARQHVIDNDEAYAQRAIERGDIGEGDRDAFKQGIRRKKDLEDKRGRGTMTNDEAVEARQLEVSRVGRAIDAATRDSHQNLVAAPASIASPNGKPGSALDDYALFQAEAPALRQGDTNAPLASKVQATGLKL